LTDDVNVMASNLTAQARSIAQVARAVVRGGLNQQITVEVNGAVLHGVVEPALLHLQQSAYVVGREQVQVPVGALGRN
jgi:hypothetical protein